MPLSPRSTLVPLHRLLETNAGGHEPESRNLTGVVRRPHELLHADRVRQLEERHSGMFSLLVFDPKIDKPVAEYVQSGALAADSGSKMLVLLCLGVRVQSGSRLRDLQQSDFIQVDAASPLSYELGRALFGPNLDPPGLLVFEGLSGEFQPVYVPFGGVEGHELRRRMQSVFSPRPSLCVERQAHGPPNSLRGFESRVFPTNLAI